MSALPITFTLPPLVRDNPATSNRRTKAARTATHHSGIHTVPSTSTTGAGNLRFDFASLYHTYRRRIYSQCFCMLHNYDDAEDAAQEVFLQLFRKVHTFRGESSFSTWLYRLTTNCVLMEIRRRRHRMREATPPRPALAPIWEMLFWTDRWTLSRLHHTQYSIASALLSLCRNCPRATKGFFNCTMSKGIRTKRFPQRWASESGRRNRNYTRHGSGCVNFCKPPKEASENSFPA